MKKILLTTIIATLFCTAYAQDNEYYHINGAQVFVLDEIYKDDVSLFFSEAKRRGVDTIFVRVFHNQRDKAHLGITNTCENGGVYFETNEACVVEDIMPELILAAKAHDIKLYAWMATRSLTFLKTSDNMSQSFEPDNKTVVGYGANLFKPDVKDAIKTLFADLAKYDIDGILLQDDFIIKYAEGADKYAKEHYESVFGKELDVKEMFTGTHEYNGKKIFTGYTNSFNKWAEYKLAYLATYLSELIFTVKEINPNIKVAANVYYETPIDYANALAWYSQSLEGLLAAGADYFAVMGYVEQIAKEKNISEIEASELLFQIASNTAVLSGDAKRVILKVQSRYFYGDKSMLNPYLFASACNYNRSLRGLSYAVVPIFTAYDINNACFR